MPPSARRATKRLALADRETPGSFLRSYLAKPAAREIPPAAGANSRLLFARGFARGVHDNGPGHRGASLWSGPRGVVATPLFTVVGSIVEALASPAFEPSLLFLISGLLIATLGLVGLGAVTMVVRVLPRWVGALVILDSPPFVLFVPSAFDNLLAYEALH
jgi:hypothetical protein